MSHTKTITALIIAGLTLTSTPAFAATKSDVKACRAAATDQNPKILEGYRLRFKKEKGVKTRTISFEAIPNRVAAGKRFKLTCRLNQTQTVLAVNTNKKIQFALNK